MLFPAECKLGLGTIVGRWWEMDRQFSCDVSRPPKDRPHFWEHTIGSGHAPLSVAAITRSYVDATVA
jgi:hypothetical protein